MSASSVENPDVLVVGGGPVGLTMACELWRHGVPCRIVDKADAPQIWSKAAAVSARTMEVFQDMGLIDQVRERGRPMYGVDVYAGEQRVAHVGIDIPGTPYPYIFGLSQRDTELLLAEHLTRLGGRFERGVELVAFEQDENAVQATLRHADGREEQAIFSWLVGCDGARSTVRRTLELPFEGSTFEQSVVQADIRAQFSWPVDANEAIMFLSDNGPLGFLPLLSEGRYRMIAMGVPDPEPEPPLALFHSLVAERAPAGTTVSDPAWRVSFRFHGRIVPSYRHGRVFLAGDAGHIHSPVGGQGMNMGIQDAYNLAWKLALVLSGHGRPSLLDSYQPERWPVGRSTVDLTDRASKNAIRFMTLRSPIAQALRNQAISFLFNSGMLVNRIFRGLGGMTIDYSASPIVGDHHSSLWQAELGGARDHERPHVSDWYRFSKGPGAGERVPDIELPVAHDGATTLFDLLRGTSHTLLLFDGAAATHEGYENLSTIAERVCRMYGERVRVHVVVPFDEPPEALRWRESVILDADTSLHEHFGCGSEALYLIRPDEYIGFRCQPAVQERLEQYLQTILIARED